MRTLLAATTLCIVCATAMAPALADDINQPPANTAAPAPLGLGPATTAAPTSSVATPGGAPASTSATASTAAPTTASSATGGDLELGRAAIDRKDWKAAMTALKRAAAADPRNADVQNLLGFASRNLGDYQGALGYYAKALSLDPKHRGALEYRGEAYVQLGQLSKAKADLASLKKICGVGCEQYRDLAKAISSYKPTAKKK